MGRGKIVFWQTNLGSNLVQSTSKNIGSKRSLAVTSNAGKKSDTDHHDKGSTGPVKKCNNFDKGPYSEKLECIFSRERGHDSLFNCSKFKSVNMESRCRFIRDFLLCWHCLERNH